MSTYWLRGQLKAKKNVAVDDDEQVLRVRFRDGEESIYCPNSDEYIVNADLVQKAKMLGATILAYSNSWGQPTFEGVEHAKLLGIHVLSYAELFKYLKEHGVS